MNMKPEKDIRTESYDAILEVYKIALEEVKEENKKLKSMIYESWTCDVCDKRLDDLKFDENTFSFFCSDKCRDDWRSNE